MTDLSEADLRMLRLALNRITDDSAWDREALCLDSPIFWNLNRRSISKSVALRSERSTSIWAARGIDEEDELPKIENATAPVTRWAIFGFLTSIACCAATR